MSEPNPENHKPWCRRSWRGLHFPGECTCESKTLHVDGWRLDIGPDGVAASCPDGGSLILFASGRIMSGGCDVPASVVQVMRAEAAKLGATTAH